MRREEVPVTPGTARIAGAALWFVVFAPTIAFVVLVPIAALSGLALIPFGGGFLTVVVVVGVVQLAAVAIGRGHHLWGVRLTARPEPPPPHNEPGIFRHGPR
jgi:hypothetical protein